MGEHNGQHHAGPGGGPTGDPATEGGGAANEEREHDERLLLDLFESATLTAWAASGEKDSFAIRLWNRGAEKTYGFSREEALGANYVELFVNPSERLRAIEDHQRIVRTGECYSWNYAADDLTKDGQVRIILANSFRLWDPRRQEYLVAEVGIDISGIENTSRQLQRAQGLASLLQTQDDVRKRLQVLDALGSVNDAVALLADPDGPGLQNVVRTICAAVRGIFLPVPPRCRIWLVDDGETPRPAQGSDELARQPVVNEMWAVQEVLAGRRLIYHDSGGGDPAGQVAEGRVRFESYAGVPLLFGAELLGVLLVFFGDYRRVDEEDRELLRHFGAHAAVAIEMARLAGEMQRRRQEDAERIRQAIVESMLHTVGNEAGRAKLAADALADELGGRGPLPARVATNLDRIRTSSQRLGQVMDELVRLSQNAYQPVRLRLAESVRVLTRTIERDHYHTIETDVVIDDEMVVQASEYLFREALGNLVRNAVQAMLEADGGGDLRISATEVEAPLSDHAVHLAQIDIEDSGPGVRPEYHDRIWRDGFTTRGDGHGHGLSQTRGLVAMLGGSVTLQDEPSDLGGAHFRVMLPAATPDAAARPTAPEGDPPGSQLVR